MHKKVPNIFTFISKFKKEEILKLNEKIGIIFRNYEKKINKTEILQLKKFCKLHKRKLYLANNPKLAFQLKLDGLYIPSFNKVFQANKYNFRKNFLIMGSAHNIYEIRKKEEQGVEIIFLSPIFKTKNYKKCLEVIRFNLLAKICKKKIIALGGISQNNISKLKITNAYGFSAISYFKKNLK